VEIIEAVLELKQCCCELGDDLYGIEIGEDTLKVICDGMTPTDSTSQIETVLGAKITIHAKTLSECPLGDILKEIGLRSARKTELLMAVRNG